MKHHISSGHRATRSTAAFTAVSAALAMTLAQAALAEDVTPPRVPASLQVPAGNVPYLVGHAAGTQNYACVPTDAGIVWQLYTPQATLFSDADAQVTTHFFSPNPLAPAEFLPTWQHSMDTSAVWVKAAAAPYTGSDFVEPGAVAWLLLKAVTTVAGPTGGDTLTATTYIHRVNTSGGIAPATGCSRPKDIGKKAFVPYTADYFFYKDATGFAATQR
jgi:Protein of unknown function (DUF3455)